MNKYKYILASNKIPKRDCPVCGTKKHWQQYINTETGEALPEQYGRCDNESKCGGWNNPYKDGYSKMIWEQEQGQNTDNWKPYRPIPQQKQHIKLKPVYIPFEVFSRTREGYDKNVFIQNLLTRVDFPFEVHDIEKVVSLYHLGTVQNGYRAGANTFPFIDIDNNVRAIQVKQFDETNHTTGTDFLHSIIEKHHTRNNKPLPEWLEAYNKNETKVSCLFGEHLLNKYPHNPIALVEAPKTAIYGALYFGFPEQSKNLLWLAVYNLSSLNLNKCKSLKGRDVYLFPDLSKEGRSFELWSNKAKSIQRQLQGASFTVSDLLEQLAPEDDKVDGKDLADYLIKQDWRLFRKQLTQLEISQVNKEILPNIEAIVPEPIIQEKPQNWEHDISELESYFKNIKVPIQSVKLNQCSTVTNVPLFIESHFATVKANNGKRTFLPYLNRLQELEKILIANSIKTDETIIV